MKQSSSFGFLVVLVALVIASGAGLASQWEKTMTLRGELELLRVAPDEVKRLQVENERLRAKQISAAELEVLRADHAALPRLRAELEALRKNPPQSAP